MDSGVHKPIGLSEAEITAFTDKALFESASVGSALARKSKHQKRERQKRERQKSESRKSEFRKSEPQKLVWVTNPTAFVRRALSGTIVTMLIGAVIGAAITISSMWVLA